MFSKKKEKEMTDHMSNYMSTIVNRTNDFIRGNKYDER